jgi:hypothetical protein
MNRLQYNLMTARESLQYAQAMLRIARKSNDAPLVAERLFLAALDRAWEAQCMANPTVQ